MINGKDIIFSADGVVIAGCTDCEIDYNCDIIETSSTESSQSKEYIAGSKSWRLTSNHLIMSLSSMFMTVGKEVEIKIKKYISPEVTADNITGKAIARNCHVTARKGSIVKGSFTFQGSGDLILPDSNSLNDSSNNEME